MSKEQNWTHAMKMPVRFKCTHEPQKNMAEELKVPAEVGAVIAHCLKIDPTQRLSAAQLLQLPFFADVSDEPFEVKELYDSKVKLLLSKYA